jgi:hypothetical protein
MKKTLFFAILVIASKFSFAQWTPASPDTYFSYTGSVGIGVSSSYSAKLQIYSPGQPGIKLQTTGASYGAGVFFQNLASTAGGNVYSMYANENGQFILGNETTHFPSFIICPNGNVGVGTFVPGSFRLAVEGKIGAREVQVTNTNPWPDYVFAPSYKLQPLAEIEQFVKQYRHLPDVPSAEDVKDGIELGKMNAILLQKIEELTLHVIELNKKIETLERK